MVTPEVLGRLVLHGVEDPADQLILQQVLEVYALFQVSHDLLELALQTTELPADQKGDFGSINGRIQSSEPIWMCMLPLGFAHSARRGSFVLQSSQNFSP